MNAITQAEFARQQGWVKSYVTKLKNDGRLVMTEDGSKVLVTESLARIAETDAQARPDVKKRNARDRGEDLEEEPAHDIDGIPHRAGSAAVKEYYLALAAKREHEMACGLLMLKEDVERAIADAATILRSSLETLPDILAPELAVETDEQRCRALLADAVEQALGEVSARFATIAKATA